MTTTIKLRKVAAAGEESALIQYFFMCGVWSLTTYTACDLRCTYCVSYAQGPSEPRVLPDQVPDQLRQELARIPSDGVIAIGALIDAYPHAESTWGVTRRALEVLIEEGRTLAIITKGDGILRDIDLLTGYPRASVNVSLPTLDEAVLRRIEPRVVSARDRLAVIRRLHEAGIAVQLHAQPWIPGLSDAEAIIEAMGGEIPVSFGPLNIQSPAMARLAWTGRLTQREINEAYVAERLRIGTRPKVTWQKPVWLGPALLDTLARGGSGGGSLESLDELDFWFDRPAHRNASESAEQRNGATVQRLIDAFNHKTVPFIALDVFSPFMRGHELSGRLADPVHPESGYFRDALHEAGSALEGAVAVATAVVGEGDYVRAEVEVTGRQTAELFGRPPTGDTVTEMLGLTFRFDDHGLVVEYWQELPNANSRV